MDDLNKHRKWIADLIVTAFNGNSKTLSAIQEQHIKLLIRWYPQITQDGKDFYSCYSNCKKKNATKKAKIELVKCKNIRFSNSAFYELEKDSPDLFPEHNPSVKQMFVMLKENQNLTAEKIFKLFNDHHYEVIMLTSQQESRIRSKKLSVSGTWIERLIAAFDADDFKKHITKENEISKYLDNGT